MGEGRTLGERMESLCQAGAVEAVVTPDRDLPNVGIAAERHGCEHDVRFGLGQSVSGTGRPADRMQRGFVVDQVQRNHRTDRVGGGYRIGGAKLSGDDGHQRRGLHR